MLLSPLGKLLLAARQRLFLIQAWIWRRMMFRTRFIAITGSVGKTTTKELAVAILKASAGPVIANFASENTRAEIAGYILKVRPWHRFAVLEVATGRPGQLARSARMVAPDVAVVLAVARTHTNAFATLEDTAVEKSMLLKFMRRNGVAILNHDDPRVAAMQPPPGVRVVRYGASEDADVRATGIGGHWPERFSFTLTRGKETARIQTQLVGLHWTSTALAAAIIALECGVPMERIAREIARIPPAVGRMEPCTLPGGAVILRDEFNASLETYQAAFAELRAARAARKILVISTVSDSPEGWDKRLRRIAVDAAGTVDLLVLVGSRDDSKRAANAVKRSGFSPERVQRCDDLRETTEFLRAELRAGDLALLRGKAEHHLTRIYFAQFREVACWLDTCPKRILCDHCPELFGNAAQASALP